MNLARTIKYAVQDGWARIVLLKRFLPLTGLGASESGVVCRILIAVAVNAAFGFVSTRPAIAVLDIRTARIFAEVVAAC